MMTRFKKIGFLLLAAVLLPALPFTVSAGAAEGDTSEVLSVGGYCDHGTYTPSDTSTVTQHLLFAMPPEWQNEITRDPRCRGTAGVYWSFGVDKPDEVFSNGWPGYACERVEEPGVDLLFAADVPSYGNGERNNAGMIVWNNFIIPGTETDEEKNPFRSAARKSRDVCAGCITKDKTDQKFDPLFRYIYRHNLEKLGVAGVAALDLQSGTFWEEINRLSAQHMGIDFETLGRDDRESCADKVIDKAGDEALDFSMFGDYASNFFNSDHVGSPELFPREEEIGEGISFLCDNMVMVITDSSGLFPIGDDGHDYDFYFYYGGGRYGTWPTESLNRQMGGISGSFAQTTETSTAPATVASSASASPEATAEASGVTVATGTAALPETAVTAPDASAVIPSAAADAASSTHDSTGDAAAGASVDSAGGSANGAVATGDATIAAVVLLALAAGTGMIVFVRKRQGLI